MQHVSPAPSRTAGFSRATIVLALALLVAACGGGAATNGPGNGNPTAPAGTEPGGDNGGALDGTAGLCGLFPADRATAALGEAVGDGTPNRGTIGGLTYFCRYTSLSGNVLDVEFSPGKTRATWDAEMTSTEMDDSTAVQGIGDAAWQSDSSGLGPGSRISAHTSAGSIWVTIAKSGDQPTMDAGAQQAAKDLISALASQ
jgi:hypothetical protein